MRSGPALFAIALQALALAAGSAAASGRGTGTISGKLTTAAPGGRPWIVYIETAPQAAAPGPAPAAMRQWNSHFDPPALVVQRGQVVEFPNQDKYYHNVFSISPGNEFDLGLYRSGKSKTLQLQTPGEVAVYCNIHPTMAAKILVLQNPFYTTVAGDGSFTITEVPEGSYTLVAWSPLHQPERQRVQLKAAAVLHVQFHLRPRPPEGGHLNKTGAQYGRYK